MKRILSLALAAILLVCLVGQTPHAQAEENSAAPIMSSLDSGEERGTDVLPTQEISSEPTEVPEPSENLDSAETPVAGKKDEVTETPSPTSTPESTGALFKPQDTPKTTEKAKTDENSCPVDQEEHEPTAVVGEEKDEANEKDESQEPGLLIKEEDDQKTTENGTEENGIEEAGGTEEKASTVSEEVPVESEEPEAAESGREASAVEIEQKTVPEEANDTTETKGTQPAPEMNGLGAEMTVIPETASQSAATPVPSVLSKASNLKLSSTGLDSITLTFNGDSAPTKYRIYRATSKNGKYTKVGTAWEQKTGYYYFEDTTVKKNTKYYYKVRAYMKQSGNTTWAKKYSAIVSGKTKPAAPNKVTGRSTAVNRIEVSWAAVAGATGYQVARSTNLYSGYTILKTINSGKKESYTDKTAKTGMQYYYRVRAFYQPASGKRIYGPYTYSSIILSQPVAPKNFAVSAGTDTSVTLSWTKAEDVAYYLLTWTWKEDGASKKDETTVSSTKDSTQLKNLEAGSLYTIEIRSIAFSEENAEVRSGIARCTYQTPARENGEAVTEKGNTPETGSDMPEQETDSGEEPSTEKQDEQVPSNPEDEEEALTIPAEEPELPEDPSEMVPKEKMKKAPEISGSSVSSAGVRLKWEAVPGAVSYRVYRSTKAQSGYKLKAKEIKTPIFLDTSADLNKGYYYKVGAVDAAGKILKGNYKAVFASRGPSVKTVKGEDGYYTLKWSAVKGADEYRVYRSVEGGAYQQVFSADRGTRSWKDTNVKAKKNYTYFVRSGKIMDGRTVLGSKSAAKSVYLGVKKNPVLKVTQNASKIKLTWEKVSNADGYVIYGAKGDGSLTRLARVSGKKTSWSQTPPAESGILKYNVRAYYTLGEKKIYAPKSDPVIIRRLAAPQMQAVRGTQENTISVSWSAVSGAKAYRVYYRTESEGDYQFIRTDQQTISIPAEGGKKTDIFVRAECEDGSVTSVGSRSPIKTMTPYWKFALLIGNSQYTEKSSLSKLAATAADVAGFSVVLDRQNGWKVNACANMTGPEILSAISRFFSGTDQNCTCLFYYSGHGLQGHNEQTGSMCGIDGSFVTTAQLKAALGKYPGKRIVLMDSCGSGAAVENESGATTLTGEKSSVITAAKAYQMSWATQFYSYFTYFLSYGSGYDTSKQAALSSLPADANGDGLITFQEISAYIAKYLKAMGEARGVTQTPVWSLPEPGAPIY